MCSHRERQRPHLKLGETKTDCEERRDDMKQKSSKPILVEKTFSVFACDHDEAP